jgi:hypothetical protein
MSHFTNGSFFTLHRLSMASLASLAISLGLATLAAVPAQAQGKTNSDLEIFGGGLVKNHPQGFTIGGNGIRPGSSAFAIRKDALEQVTWYKSRRQVSIEDESPIVTIRSGSGQGNGAYGKAQLTPATFGGSGAMASAMGAPRNLIPAQFGPMVKPELAQARPLMHSSNGTSQGKPGGSNAAIASAPGRSTPTSAPTTYGGYKGGPAVSASTEFEAAHLREVKARLLPDSVQ